MKIHLLPISTRQALVYCQKSAEKTVNAAPLSISQRVQKKAAETWSGWEEAKSGWKKTITTYGNAGLKRVPYQEWGLKSFPPSSPKLQAEQLTEGKKFDIFYPANVMQQADVPKVLARLASERKTLHWNRFIGSAIMLPISIPFAIVPVIPNIPFFYFAFRCWSHWRALKGSDHLDFILDNRLYKISSPPKIEKLYNEIAPNAPDFTFVTATHVEENTLPDESLILKPGCHTAVAKDLGVPELATEVDRAVWQVDNSLKERDKKLKEAATAQTGTTSSPPESKTSEKPKK